MLELEDALKQVLAAVPPPVLEEIPLSEASGRILTQPALSPVDLPRFDNSAMDGFAVRAADLVSASADRPAGLRVIGRVAAGEIFPGEVPGGCCVRIFTGSPLPRGADAVVMQEDTRPDPQNSGGILALEPVKPGENVRRQGEDVPRGSVLIAAGERIGFGQIAILAAAGVARVKAGRQPRVGVLATGSELKELGEPLEPGQIYESNRLMLAPLLRQAGTMVRLFQLVTDSLSATRHALEQAFAECDAVITSGGASVGETDFVKQAFAEVGGDLQFWKVAMRPGRPFVFGRRKGKLLFGLPGNPVSALVTFLLLVRPALLRWQGAARVGLPADPAVLAEPLSNPGNRRHFLRVKVDAAGKVYSAGAQASHALSSLARANGLLDMPPETTLASGTAVQILRWD